jgi:hypothetical protein
MGSQSNNSNLGEGVTPVGGAVQLPKGTRPLHPIKRPECELELTKKLVIKSRERLEKMKKLKEEAFTKSLQHAANKHTTTTNGLLPIDPRVQDRISNILNKRERPVSTGSTLTTGRGSAFNTSRDGVDTSRKSSDKSPTGSITGDRDSPLPDHFSDSFAENVPKQQKSPSFITKGVAWNEDPDDPENVLKLKSELQELRLYKANEQITLQKLSEELSSNETLLYIKHIEDELAKQHQQVKDLAHQLHTSKVANSSLSRMLDKTSLSSSMTRK